MLDDVSLQSQNLVFRVLLQGVENVYTQHQPLLFQVMESIVKGRLRDVDYPFFGNHFQQGRFAAIKYKLFIVILFVDF